jgi:rubredoxin
MGKYKFVSNRVMKNSKGEEKGKMRVMVLSGTETAHIDYVCPECGLGKHEETPWVRPFALKCPKCGFVLKLPKLKDEIKKEKKQAKLEMEKKAGLGG